MSVDTTVLILGKDGKYFVDIVGAVENITDDRDDEAIDIFVKGAEKNNYIADTLELAMELAKEAEDRHTDWMGYPSEYGIRVFLL